jgi:hypothetical protein
VGQRLSNQGFRALTRAERGCAALPYSFLGLFASGPEPDPPPPPLARPLLDRHISQTIEFRSISVLMA